MLEIASHKSPVYAGFSCKVSGRGELRECVVVWAVSCEPVSFRNREFFKKSAEKQASRVLEKDSLPEFHSEGSPLA